MLLSPSAQPHDGPYPDPLKSNARSFTKERGLGAASPSWCPSSMRIEPPRMWFNADTTVDGVAASRLQDQEPDPKASCSCLDPSAFRIVGGVMQVPPSLAQASRR